MTPVSYAGWQHVQCWFLLGKEDHALPREFEKMIVSQPELKDPVVQWIEDAGHTMFVSHVKATADFIVRAAKNQR